MKDMLRAILHVVGSVLNAIFRLTKADPPSAGTDAPDEGSR